MYWQTRAQADVAISRSTHRRELSEIRRRRRRRLRWILLFPFAIGLAVGGWCVVHGDHTGGLTLLSVGLTVPFLSTFDLLGEAPR